MKTVHHFSMVFTWALIFTTYCLIGVNGEIKMDPQKNVTGVLSKNVVIPCSFRVKPNHTITNATVIWRKEKPFEGPLLYRCEWKANISGNCTKSAGRFSFGGNLTEQNISLQISHVKSDDAGLYYCRVELAEISDQFTIRTGIELKVKDPKELTTIYIKISETGERQVTCETSGNPPPNVTWIQPENMTSSQIIVQTRNFTSSFSLPASPNTNYTCQIDGDSGPEARSIYNKEYLQCSETLQSVSQDHIYLPLSVVSVVVLGVLLIAIIYGLVAWFCRVPASRAPESSDNVYHSYPPAPEIDGIYMTPPVSSN